MTMDIGRTPTKAYCNCLALERGLDPAGYAGSFDDALVIEAPLPWKYTMMREAEPLPQKLIDLFELWLQRYHETGNYPHRPLVIAPDADYSREGYRRVMHYTRPTGKFAQFDKVEYLVPESAVGDLAWALYEARETLAQFDAYRVPENDSVRDLMVCTHGTVDVACAKFGYPIYKFLREQYADDALRVWRVSHFGGHVFAPTLMDMPTGHYWAYVGEEQAQRIATREGDVSALRGHYRGWAGLESGFQQAAERELWQQTGWAWFDYPKAGIISAQDDAETPQWADVRLMVDTATGSVETDVHVSVSHTIETPPSTDKPKISPYPQYHAEIKVTVL